MMHSQKNIKLCFAMYADTDITNYCSWIYEVCNRETCEQKQMSDTAETNVFRII
jgi:hypothetical protein